MYYTIYKITNLINNKIYIGKHQTNDLDDNYMGSGKYLTHSQKKYGLDNFKKEILFIFEDEQPMNSKEAELVTEEFCNRDDTYNICPGGKGGWGYVNSKGLGILIHNQKNDKIKQSKIAIKEKNRLLREDKEWSNRYRETISKSLKGKQTWWLGRKHKQSTKDLQSLAASKRTGSKNSQFGTCWIVNKDGPIKIKKKDLDKYLELGYIRGRKLNDEKEM